MLSSRQLIGQFRLKPQASIQKVVTASICHKSDLPEQKKVKRWPYERRAWGYRNFFLDPFTKRKFNENSTIIQVEGNVHCGKEDFARRLADELGMYYMPHIDLDSYYKNEFGFDYRGLNPLLPERLRHCDWEMFHENPSRHSVVHMQNFIFKLRLLQYIEAIRHLFNTGQGVVLNRSVFTEKVFVDAMHEVGWLPLGYLNEEGVRFYDWRYRYNYARNLCLTNLLKPHLTIYLDTPVDVCLDRIKRSSEPLIANSKALVPEFLEAIKQAYDDDMMQRVENYSHVLKYDYPERATDDELIDVIDDIKTLDFNQDDHDTKFDLWLPHKTKFWHFHTRKFYTTTRCVSLLEYLKQPWFDIAGLGDSVTQADLMLRDLLYEGHTMGMSHGPRQDPSITNIFKIFLNWEDFGTQWRAHTHTDFT